MPSGATSSDLAGVTNTDPIAAGWLSQTSFNSRMFPDASGVFRTYASGTAARDDAGLWHAHNDRLQLIKNNTMTGAGAGVLPTGWVEVAGAPAGITRTVNGTVTLANGLTALDVTFSGTASAGGTYWLQFGANADIGVRELKTCVPAAGGTGHAVGDIITLATTGGTVVFAPRIRVDAVNGGGLITACSIVSGGSIRIDPTTNPITQASTTGVGTGATFTVTYGLMTALSLSGYLQLVSGTLDRTAAAAFYLNFATNVNGQVGAQQWIDDRLLNRDTATRRMQKAIAPTGGTAVLAKPSFQFLFTNGSAYNVRLYIAMPMLEPVPSLASDASYPIPTTTVAVLNRADVIQVTGGPLTLAQDANCGIEITMGTMTHNGIEHRAVMPLLTANSSTNLLARDTDGAIYTSAGSARTYKTWRSNYALECTHALTWGGGSAVVASTANAQSKSASSGQPAITTLQLAGDGCIKELKIWNGKISTAGYQSVSAQVAHYGATSGGIVGAAASKDIGASTFVIQSFREVDIGGMSANGLVRIDANDYTQFGGMSKDMLYWSNEVIGASGSPTSTVDPIPKYVLRYFDYLTRSRAFKVYPTRPSLNQAGGIASVTKNGGTKRITSVTTVAGSAFTADYFQDNGYEGDLMAASGVSYITGREAQDNTLDANGVAKDPQNGDKGSQNSETDSFGYSGSIFRSGSNVSWTTQLAIDPWITAGDNTSGLLAGIQYDAAGTQGAADDTTQAYNFRMTLTKTAAIKQNFPNTAPTGYLPQTYEILGRWFQACRNLGYTAVSEGTSATTTNYSLANLGIFNGIGGNAYFDLNNANGFSTDWIGSNWGAQFQAITGSAAQHYCEATNAERSTYWNALKSYLLGFWYYLQYDCVNEVAALSATINAGGTGYAVGDRIVMDVANTMFSVVAKVKTVSSGAVTAVEFIGSVLTRNNSAPSNPVSQLSTSGSGTGCTLNITWGSRVASQINSDALLYGLAADHYRDYCEEDFAGWMQCMYLREGRRMVGLAKMHSSDVLPTIGSTPVISTNTAGSLSYAIDSHSHKRYAKQRSGVWYTENEGWVSRTRGGYNTYAPIPMEILLPARSECTNLGVSFCVSSSHPAFGAERMELSHMTLSESLGILFAQMALGSKPDVQDFDYSAYRTVALARGLVLPQTN